MATKGPGRWWRDGQRLRACTPTIETTKRDLSIHEEDPLPDEDLWRMGIMPLTPEVFPTGRVIAASVLRLTEQQLQALRSCDRGISIRFENCDIVNALLTAGFVERNVAGVIRVTKAGHEYLSYHATS